jgi:hypothetical protein
MPDPVTLSLAEAVYNQACVAIMDILHMSMALSNFDLKNEQSKN